MRGPVVLFVSALDDATAEALRYVRAIAGDGFQAIHVADAGGVTGIAQAWRGFSGGDGPPLLGVAARAHRLGHGGALRAGDRSGRRARSPRSSCPSCSSAARWSPSCGVARRSRCGCACRARRTSCSPMCPSWPTRAGSRRPPTGQPKTTVLLPISELNAASRHAAGLCARPRLRARGRPPRGARQRRRLADARSLGGTRASHPDQGRAVALPRPRAAAARRDPRDHRRPRRRLRGRDARDHQPARLAAPAAQPARAVHQAVAAVRGARRAHERAVSPARSRARRLPVADGAARVAARSREALAPSAPVRSPAMLVERATRDALGAPAQADDGRDLARLRGLRRLAWRCSRSRSSACSCCATT